MNLLKFMYPKTSLKRKILDIEDDIKKTVRLLCDENFWIDWYGAYYVHPKHLVFWVCVKSDNMKAQLESDQNLLQQLKSLLEKHNYPVEARPDVSFGFESQETVDRESNGDWHLHFQ